MYLVTEGKRKENQLGYAKKTSEYVYLHKGKEQWRMVDTPDLLNYFNEVRAGMRVFDDKDIKNNVVWQRYEQDCDKFNKEYLKELGII